MKDLNLEVGESCYIGQEELICEGSIEEGTYTIGKGDLSIFINLDGSIHGLGGNPIVSLTPYEMPKMNYQKIPEVGELCYFWDDDVITREMGVTVSFFEEYNTGYVHPFLDEVGDRWSYCSVENPLLKL